MTAAAASPLARPNKAALTAVLAIHGAALAALVLAKGPDVFRNAFTPIHVVEVPLAKVPPEKPEPQPKVPVEQQRQVIDTPKPIIDTIAKPELALDHVIIPTPVLTLTTGTVARATETIVPTLPPEPRKIEPARAKANLASYVSDADYPSTAIRNEEQGTTRFRLVVAADGHVTDCTVTGSSGSAALDATTCRLMKSRARFSPARDSDGRPTGDTVANAIRWVLPEA
jgi:protein TonB